MRRQFLLIYRATRWGNHCSNFKFVRVDARMAFFKHASVLTALSCNKMQMNVGVYIACHAAELAICFDFQFLICSLSLVTFAVSRKLPQNRLQLTFTLVLTLVAFKICREPMFAQDQLFNLPGEFQSTVCIILISSWLPTMMRFLC